MTTSGVHGLPSTTAEWIKRAEATLDRQSKSMVDDAITFAMFVRDHAHMVDNYTECKEREAELVAQRRCLARQIEAIAAAKPHERQHLIDEALLAARGML